MIEIKKKLSMFLAVLMLLSCVPFTAYAEDGVVRQDASGSSSKYYWEYTASTNTLYFNTLDSYDEAIVDCTDTDEYLPAFNDAEETFSKNNVFNYASNIIIGNNIKYLYMALFDQNKYPNLETVTFEENSSIIDITDQSFEGSSLKKLVLPDSPEFTTIYSGLLYGLEVDDLVIPETYTTVDTQGFYYLTTETLVIPDSVEYIGDEAFDYTDIKNVVFPENENLQIGEYLFDENYVIETVKLSSSVKEISDYCFYNCMNLTQINLENVETIGESAFWGTKVSDVDLSSIKTIGISAFYECGYIQKLDFPSTLSSIGNSAFTLCDSLSSVTFSDGEDLTIGNRAFYGDTNLLSITLTPNVKSINSNAFDSCKLLREINFESDGERGLTSIGEYAFKDTKISSLTLPSTVSEVSSNAFRNMTSLKTADMSNAQFTDIPDYLFASDSLLNTVALPNNCTSIGKCAFDYCSALKDVVVPDTVTYLADHAFSNCTSLKNVVLSSNINSVPDYTFYGCSNLENVTFNGTINSIGKYAFYNCSDYAGDVPNTVVSVGDYSFYNTSIEKITLASDASNNYVGSYAFRNCRSLQQVNLPSTLTSIGENAFYYCESLLDFDIPSSVTSIGAYAFMYSGLTSVTIPASVTTLGESAFSNCSNLGSLNFEDNTQLETISKSCFQYTALTSLTIPEGIKTIDELAFANCASLTYVEFPYSVETLGKNSFTSCPLETAYFLNPKTVLSSSYLFYYKKDTSYAYNTDGIIYGYLGSTAESYAYSNSINFVNLDSTEDFDDLTATSSGTWDNGTWKIVDTDTGVTLVIVGEGDIDNNVLYLSDGTKSTVANVMIKYSAVKLVIRDGITSIPNNYIDYYSKSTPFTNNTYLVLPNTLTSIGSYAFCNMKLKGVSIPNSVTELGEYAFAKNLMSNGVLIGSGVTSIPEKCFSDCTSLKSIVIPENVQTLGVAAFKGTSLSSGVTFKGNNITNIPDFCFYQTSIKSVEIPDGVTTLSKGAFAECSSLIKITVPRSVKSIYRDTSKLGVSAFGYDKDGNVLSTLTVYCKKPSDAYDYAYLLGLKKVVDDTTDENGYFYRENSANTWSYVSENKTLYLYCSNYVNGDYFYYSDGTKVKNGDMDVETIVVSNSVTKICGSLKTSVFAEINPEYIILPNTLKSVDEYAFNDCTNLKAIEFPDSVTSINSHCFKNCTSLEYVKFGSGLATVPSNILKNSKSLKMVEFSDGITTIGSEAFKNCINLVKINIPDSITAIENCAFYKCVNVRNITIGTGLKNVGFEVFGDLPLCEKVTVNSPNINSLTNTSEVLRYKVFNNLGTSTKGVEVIFGEKITTANLVFFNDTYVSKITLGDNVQGITNLYSMPQLEEVEVSNENNYLYSADNCLYSKDDILIMVPSKLDSVTIQNGTTAIGDSAFASSNVVSVSIPFGVKTIGDSSFINCKKLKKITFPSSLTTIGSNSFKNCTALKTVDIRSSIKTIGDNAFEDCVNLASVIMSKVETIGNNAFSGCVALKGVVVPETTTSIGDNAFADCLDLEEIYIFTSSIGADAFANDQNLTIYTIAGSDAYAYAREQKIPYCAYTDEDAFYDLCAMKLDAFAGYIGFCTDGHGDTEYLTVYEADCTHDGYIIGVCEYCSEIVEEIHESSTGHNYKQTASVEATENTKGMNVYTCSNCGDTYCDYIPATNSDVQTTTQIVTGKVLLASNKYATSGKAPAVGVSLVIDGITVATTDESGNFSMELETGVYEVVLHYTYGFDRIIYVAVGNEDLECGSIAIIGCDWNKDGKVDEEDYNLFRIVISAQQDDPSYLYFVDMNNDGYINARDMAIIQSCMGIDSSKYVYDSVVVQ